MDNFTRADAKVRGIEAGFSNDPHDPGNWTGGKCGAGELKGTKGGISAAAYPDLDIQNLTDAEIQAIYLRDYWLRCHCDKLSWCEAVLVYDCAVNQGQPTAIRLLQTALGVTADGQVGPGTLAAIADRAPLGVAVELAARRMVHYGDAGGWDDYKLGWSRRLMGMLVSAVTLGG